MIIIYVTFRYVLPTSLQRANAVIIINCNRQVYSTHEVTKRKCKDYYYRNLQVCSIIINVTFRYVLPTRLQRANAVIIIKCNRQVYSTHEVTKGKCNDYY